LGNLPLNLSTFSHLGQVDFSENMFCITDFANFSLLLGLALQKQPSLPEILSAVFAKAFTTKVAVFNCLEGRPLFQAVGASIRADNKSTAAVVFRYLGVRWLFLASLLAKHENWIINQIQPELFFSAAETKRDILKRSALLHAGC